MQRHMAAAGDRGEVGGFVAGRGRGGGGGQAGGEKMLLSERGCNVVLRLFVHVSVRVYSRIFIPQ